MNINITENIILNNPDKPWNLKCVVQNPNIIYSFILSSLKNSKWTWEHELIVLNKFTLQNKLIRDQCRKELTAINCIKRNFLKAFWDPVYQLGRKRLARSLREDYFF